MTITLQQISTDTSVPTQAEIELWANAILSHLEQTGDICIRIVDAAEIAELNQTYRHKKGPTNILSFPATAPKEMRGDFLGDLIICASIVNQGPITWAHIVIHGILHLLGYDHETDKDAEKMEQIEQEVLKQLCLAD